MINQFTPTQAIDQGFKLARYLPNGKAWEAKNDNQKNLHALLLGWGAELYRLEATIQLLSNDFDINQTQELIREWETSVGIPDECFEIDDTVSLETRRLNILNKFNGLAIQTAESFEDLAALYGFDVTVTAGFDAAFFPYTFPFIFFASDKEARFTIIVNSLEDIISSFPYTFPFEFVGESLDLLKCLFSKIKPANCIIIYT